MIKNELLKMTEDIDTIDDRLMTLTLRGTVPHTFTNTYMYTAENHELNVERYTKLEKTHGEVSRKGPNFTGGDFNARFIEQEQEPGIMGPHFFDKHNNRKGVRTDPK